jgi:hypothetical protein
MTLIPDLVKDAPELGLCVPPVHDHAPHGRMFSVAGKEKCRA